MGQYLENWSKKMVTARATKQKDKIFEKNGKLYIFTHRGNGKYDDQPNEYSDWEEAADKHYRIYG